MASTTKIMTCILALESGIMDSENQIVTVSDQAATQPKVHLGMVAGERFYLKDLLYSLMLESHNDSGVAIAEAVAGSVEKFADLMNRKARTIGCYSTYLSHRMDWMQQIQMESTTLQQKILQGSCVIVLWILRNRKIFLRSRVPKPISFKMLKENGRSAVLIIMHS